MTHQYEVTILSGNTRIYQIEAVNVNQAKRKAEEDYEAERTNWAEGEVTHVRLDIIKVARGR